MYDVFLALCTMDIPRGHPAYMAMLYSFCPAAAGWWASGLVMEAEHLPYNAAWQVLSDYASGSDLSTQLARYGLDEKTIGPIKTYLEAIAEIRARQPYERAPELQHGSILKMDAALRFGIQDVFTEHFGGDWRNVFVYARVWAYVLMDWAREICGQGQREFTLARHDVLFRPSGTDPAVPFPVFVWKTGAEASAQPVIGIPSRGAYHNQFRSALAQLSAPDADHTWSMEPLVSALDPVTGAANPFEPVEGVEQLVQDLFELGRAVQGGPFPPLAAYADPSRCAMCIFKFQCYGLDHKLSPPVRRLIAPQRAQARSGV